MLYQLLFSKLHQRTQCNAKIYNLKFHILNMTNYGKIAALYLSRLWLIGIRITVKTNKAYSKKHYTPNKLSSIAQAYLIFLFGKLLEAKISSKSHCFRRLKGKNITVRQATWPLYQLTREKSEKLPSMGMIRENLKLHYMSIISALALQQVNYMHQTAIYNSKYEFCWSKQCCCCPCNCIQLALLLASDWHVYHINNSTRVYAT